MNRLIAIPPILRPLHGEQASIRDLVLTYLAAAFAAVIVVLEPGARPGVIEWWAIAVVALVAADFAGGLVATHSSGTSAYYAARPRLRTVAILVHVVQPTVLFFVVGGPVEVWAVVPAFTILAALLVGSVPAAARRTLAAALVAAGIIIAFAWPVITPPEVWFAPIFLVKLVHGLAVSGACAGSARSTAHLS
jgi:hypothetical protein